MSNNWSFVQKPCAFFIHCYNGTIKVSAGEPALLPFGELRNGCPTEMSNGAAAAAAEKRGSSMRFVIHIGSRDVRAALVRLLDAWRSLTCSSMELFDWTPDLEPAPGILFWDLDDGPPPAVLHRDEALVLCSSSSRAAISSYAIHPAGFLRKPIRMPELQAVLHRCVDFWWDSLERLEIISDRCRFRLPLYDVVWAESARRGCLIHSSRAAIPAHEPLASLESRLPRPIFLRCQRGFLVNLCHVRRLDTLGFHMSDGAVVPLSRNSRAGAAERYRQLCLLRHGETGEIRNA